ncbi:helix-turn-helix domain-containing protein [Flavobacterium sp. MC2016-06]|jgi:AraC-like DNA-binding protein|uniref:AraC family transcriptional regulator n=1 Tax=Flavobacterium sp. MC2016-06 TaxID=2676308 RepID=UPI0012BACA82|nr:AraC family transcriptional regulator [Flavobacterium sp. MC2016-06]MBU3860643.1 AraC family transcriptional regulator [Flavobacterium sp. MC2016-06]
MNNKRPPGEIFNYSNIFFSYYLDDGHMCASSSTEHKLIYLYSGEIILNDSGKETVIKQGECVFLKKNTNVTMLKQPKEGKQFATIYLLFNRNFLRKLYQTIDKNKLPLTAGKKIPTVVKIEERPDITSLFESLTPYFNTAVVPSDEVVNLKIQEGIYSLLSVDKDFYPCLFDFTEPWKIDILDFLNDNYTYDLSIEEIAGYTGRSLASFKRDFKKISSLTPQKWINQKRLDEARKMLEKNDKKIQDVCFEVGFKNVSHFSRIYKDTFGHAPTQLA